MKSEFVTFHLIYSVGMAITCMFAVIGLYGFLKMCYEFYTLVKLKWLEFQLNRLVERRKSFESQLTEEELKELDNV